MEEKNYNIELIRTLSFVFVIVIHVTNYYCRGYAEISRGEYGFALILDAMARVSVPCFFMMSGALLLGEKPNLDKNVRRLFRFFKVLLVWSVIYYFFNVYYMHSKVNLKAVLFEPVEAHLWYLYALLPIYLVLPFFQIMCWGMKKKYDDAFIAMCLVVVVAQYISSLFHEEPYYDVPLLGDRAYTFYFFAGYFIQKYRNKIPWRFPVVASIFAGSTAFEIVLTALVSFKKGDHYERLLEYGCPFVVISGVAFFMMLYKVHGGQIEFPRGMKKWMDRLGGCSFGIYLIHILFLDIFKKYVDPGDLSAYLVIPVLSVGLCLLSYLCVYGLNKTPLRKVLF